MTENKYETPFSSVGYITYKRTYARRLNEADPNSPTEEFEDTVNRVVAASNSQLNVGFTSDYAQMMQYFMRFMEKNGKRTLKKAFGFYIEC